jgi:hypothetical protein
LYEQAGVLALPLCLRMVSSMSLSNNQLNLLYM